jgi:hypothetical protein
MQPTALKGVSLAGQPKITQTPQDRFDRCKTLTSPRSDFRQLPQETLFRSQITWARIRGLFLIISTSGL